MRSTIKCLAVASVFIGATTAASAQQHDMDSTQHRFAKKPFRTLSVGLNAGALTHYTPFNNASNGDFKTPQTDWGYGGYVKEQILPGFGIQADFLAGEIIGKRSNALLNYSTAQDQSKFKTNIQWSAALSANFTVANVSFNHKRAFFLPYVTGGAGYMSSGGRIYNTQGYVAPVAGYHENWFIPVGAGFKLALCRSVNLDFGYTVAFVKSNEFYGLNSAADNRFSYAHGGVEIPFGKRHASQLQNFSAAAALREEDATESAELRGRLAAMQQQRDADARQYAQDMADDDADGVANKFDKCPGTPAGKTVDGSGCPLTVPAPVTQVTERIVVTEEDKKVVNEAIKNLEFDNGKATIKPTSLPALHKVAELLMQKNFSLKLAGHTDNVGSASANMRLSKNRAEAVKAYLVQQGANPSRIEATGYGATQPIATNKTAEGRQQNRRVEFTLF